MSEARKVESHLFVVFGATGDLMTRKLLPAIQSLSSHGLFEKSSCHVLGVARSREFDDSSFRRRAGEDLADYIGFDRARLWCENCLHYHSIGESSREDYRLLKQRMDQLEREHDLPGNRIFYLALPPQAFRPTIRGLGESGAHDGSGWKRLVVEKPFGRDLASAQELNRLIHQYFAESEVYRIDHYLGKETVQNLLVFRFANPLFESSWNRDRVECVQITVAEEVGIGQRAGYYDQAGALRDMVQNHLTQLLTLTAMDVPAAFTADDIRQEKVKVLRSLAPFRPEDVVLGQYAPGMVGGQAVLGYRDEKGVDPESKTETFAALRFRINSWRWQGVPFYLRTGKRLPRRTTQISVRFRCPPVAIFRPNTGCRIHANAVILTLQPDEGFDLLFEVKVPGEQIQVETQRLRFQYEEAFAPLPDAYETLLLDLMRGDQTLFVRADEVEESWRVYAPFLEQKVRPYIYAAGTWGPRQADELLDRGCEWIVL